MITYRQVKLAETQTVIESFLVEQWAHTGDKNLKCEPNWAIYHALESAGSLLLLLAYDDARPIGYLAAMVHPHVNSVSNKVASIPTYYVEERPGRSLVMRTLIQYALQALRSKGIVQATIDTDFEHSAGRLLGKLGFRPVKIGYKMDLTLLSP